MLMSLAIYGDLKKYMQWQLSNDLYYRILSAINKDYKMMKNIFRFATRKLNNVVLNVSCS